ncbi:hypothetical protein [Nocardia terpenica]|uniref:Uncharacterized protein n=1 Tax=Nocardia terpenica TaxID=455432 RepID=A0A6G9YXQ5_9NOCA|nr:hypothetical protein [Nocardia terpenica]QIS17994.1 hypothetical protein F6W96_06435 [Nocardia terpenica]
MGPTFFRHSGVAAALGVALLAAPVAQAEPTPLNGLFALAPGVCANGAVTGSFFRMILPTGDAGGPYLQNSDSHCSDQTVTPLSAGTDGGLVSGSYQPQPDAAFDAAGNARSGRVTTPVRFYGVDFATATNPTDPQTGSGTGRPEISSSGGQLSGDLSSLGVTWNNQVFNQGSPKPGGGLPGKTSPVHGSIDGAGNFVLEWTSQIVGGPFNNFTGLWHLAGQYRGGPVAPAAAPIAPPPPAPAAAAAPAPPVPAAAQPGVAPAAPGQPGAASAASVQPDGTPAASTQPGGASMASAQQIAHGNPVLATRTIDLPARQHVPVWVIPVLVLVAIVAAGVFVKADAIAGRKRS